MDSDILESLGLAERFITLFDEELKYIETQLKLRTKHVEAVERLQTIPGIGLVCAATIYAVIGDINRFPNARSLASYAGLVPIVRASGEKDWHGGITKQGSNHLRATLVQSAHVVARPTIRNAEVLQAFYARVRGKRGRRKIALVALARHLLAIAFRVWRDETNYATRLSS